MALSFSILSNPDLNRQLLENGFVKFPFLGEEGIETLTQHFAELLPEPPTDFFGSGHQNDIDLRLNASNAIKAVFEPAIHQQFEACSLLGASYMFKPSDGISVLEPHQDWRIVDEKHFRSFNIWVPMVDVDANNGALHLMPKSHLWQETYRGPNIFEIYRPFAKTLWKVMEPVEMKAGEALVFDQSLLHASSPNSSGKARLAAVFGLIPAAAELRFYHSTAEGTIEEFAAFLDFFRHREHFSGPEDLEKLGTVPYTFPDWDEESFIHFLREKGVKIDLPIHEKEEKPPEEKTGLFQQFIHFLSNRKTAFKLRKLKR